jgi:hypothetical protein
LRGALLAARAAGHSHLHVDGTLPAGTIVVSVCAWQPTLGGRGAG